MKVNGRIAGLIFTLFAAGIAYAQPKPAKPGKPKEIAPAVQIYFDLNKAAVKKAEKAKLDKLIEDLKSKKEFKVLLTGHTDSLGSNAYNEELSQSRVDNVYDYLLEMGLDSAIMEKHYYGASKPREGNDDEEKRAKNRRVEITIIEKPKPVEKPKPKPVVKDTCNHDTTVFIGSGMSITMNVCEFHKMCRGKGAECITVDRKTTLDEIFESGVALKTQKGEGFNWAGIFDIKFPSDSCLKNGASYTFTLDLETYKKAKLNAFVDKNGYLELDKATKIRIVKTKTEVKITVPVKCSGVKVIAGTAGKGKVAKIKDKTGKIETMYVVSDNPNTILPCTKKGKFWYVNYSSIQDPKLYVMLQNGETMITNIDLNTIRKTKKKGELRKKYKVKTKHLNG